MNKNIFHKRFWTSLVISLVMMSGSLHSCKDFLDISTYFNDELQIDSVFAETRYILSYTWGIAAMFWDEADLYRAPNTPGILATDEAFTLFATSGYPGMAFALGEVNSENLRGLGQWGDMYKAIRKCNTIFARIGEATDMNAVNRNTILGYTHFFRGYAYYKLLLAFGPPILLGDELLETNEDLAYYDRQRTTYDEAVEYICSELEQAAMLMPAKLSVSEFGRPTQGAAYGLIARLRMFHASPLFNGGQAARIYFGKWKRSSDGVNYVSQTYDEKRWAIAAAACKRVIDYTVEGKPIYKLYTIEADDRTPELPKGVTADPDYYKAFPEGAAGIDHYKSYTEMFNGEAVGATNPEYVWGRMSGAIASITRESFPMSASGWNGMCVPQKIIDNYRMVDGRDINNSSNDYPYREEGFTPTSNLNPFSSYTWAPATEIFNMYINREVRFYASIGFSQCFWPCSSTTTAGRYNITASYYYDSPNGKSAANNPIDYPVTGYVIKKMIHPNDAWGGDNNRRLNKSYGIIRLADILLYYTEALNNLTTAHTVTVGEKDYTVSRDLAEMKKSFNQVRYRAGLPGMSPAELDDRDAVQANIERERMIELLHEDARYFDVRRWGKYEESENEPIMGMNADATKESFYQRVIPSVPRIGKRIVDRKMVLVPLPKAEIKRLPSCDQNPGWD
ncbi:MAG: RagB/SusD family nutrient uptake outer membrane protein [Tannerella sp.]|jgi:hypothetical protein|nr:RagB/SusD family nutrient uptake outer membrane protein [Tannerella sp.]